jgi:hypothetical protein
MSILENFKPTMPTGNTNNFGNFVSAFYNFLLIFPLVLPSISVIISSICLYSLSKHYLNLQFVKNSEKDLKLTKINQNLNAIFYELLESKNGYITVLDLAVKSGLDSVIVTGFLNQKVQHFGGKSVLSVDGDVAWKFDYLTKNEILEVESEKNYSN